MRILGNVEFGHMEARDQGEKRLVSRQPDSGGAVTVVLDFQNDSSKTVRSAVFSLVPYDASGQAISCAFRGCSEVRLAFSGVMEPGGIRRRAYWEHVWYNPDITRVELTKLEVSYADGSAETLHGTQIPFDHA